MRNLAAGASALGAAIVLLAASCGGGSADAGPPPAPGTSAWTEPAESPPAPAGEEKALPPADTPVAPAPHAASPPPAPPGVGGPAGADLADALPTVPTMAESTAPLPPPKDPGDSPEGIEGVVVVPVTSAEHVRYDVEYPTSPPAGGPHLGIWLNCGFYTVPVLDELAVHSLEHGAVWVTYRSDVVPDALRRLAALAVQSSHILVSPYERQESPLVLSAWGRQLALDSPDDPRFDRFLEVYLRDGPTTPEPGAACSGAVGVPPEHPEAVPQQG